MQEEDDIAEQLVRKGYDEAQARHMAKLLVSMSHGADRLNTQRIIAHIWSMAFVIVAAVWVFLNAFVKASPGV